MKISHIAVVSAVLFTACSPKQKRTQASDCPDVPVQSSPASALLAQQFAEQGQASKPYTNVSVRRVIFYEKFGLRLRVKWMKGRLFPTRTGAPASFDDPTSFRVVVDQGITEISLQDLSRLLSSSALKNSRLTNVRFSSTAQQEIQINATLHRLFPLPIQLNGHIEAAPDSRLRIKIEKIRVLKIPFGAMLRSMKLSPRDLADIRGSKAIEVSQDSIYIKPEELLPPPHQGGNITAVHMTRDGNLEEDYGNPNSQELRDSSGKQQNFMQLEGGVIRFGKLLMQNADMTLVDTSPGDWFSFDLAHYNAQLVAGDMHITKAGGLLVFTPDVTKINISPVEKSATP